jgi:superfamily I DNA/RNA helicase
MNYRSKAHIVQAGNELIKKNRRQYEKEIIAHRTEQDMIRVFTFQDEIDEAQQLI